MNKKHLISILIASVIVISGCSFNEGISKGKSSVVILNDSNIEYFREGEGDVILLLSGRGLDVNYLEPLARDIALKGFQVIRINRRGAGRSTGSLKGITYHTHAKDIAGVVSSLDINSVNVLGHALGGRISRVFSSDYPELTNSIIVMPASGKVKGDSGEAKATSKLFSPNATDEEISEGMKYMVGNPADSDRIWKVIKNSTLISSPETLRSEATMKTPLSDWWAPAGTVPYLIVHGLEDKSAPVENAELLKLDLGARATIVKISGVGHLAPVESPNKVATAVSIFLKKHPISHE